MSTRSFTRAPSWAARSSAGSVSARPPTATFQTGSLGWRCHCAAGTRGGTGPAYGERFGLVASPHATDEGGAEDVDQATPVAEAFSLSSSHRYKLATGWTYAGGGTFHYEATSPTTAAPARGPGRST